MDLKRIYTYALQREYEGRDFFTANASKMHNRVATGILKRLAAEEEKHIAFIQALLSENAGSETAAAAAMLGDEAFFSARAESEQIEQTVIESMTPDVTILRMAYLIERDFAEFYEMAADQTEGEAQQALRKLANWEHSHEKLFKDLHDRIYEAYMEMPWGG